MDTITLILTFAQSVLLPMLFIAMSLDFVFTSIRKAFNNGYD